MTTRRAYPSDLSDARWALIEPRLSAWRQARTLPGFVPVRKRWIVEQAFGTLMLHRRLVREYETRCESSVSRTLWASMTTMIHRLTGTSTRTWRQR